MKKLFNYKTTLVNILVLGIFFNISYSQNWEEDYETVPFDNEFSATIAAAQVFIDGVEQTGGQLAAFGEDGEISALDANGATFFPPGGTNVYDLSIWSNNASGEVMTFKFYDAANDVVIDLDETYSFTSNDVVGDGFSPFQLTGSFPNDDGDDDGDECVTGDDIQWEEDYETVPFDNEFSATIAAAQVFIDGVEQTGGQLAAFGEDGEISALDANGATFFPPGGTNVYDLSIWSNNASGEVMTFKFYDAANDVVIDLDETYSFTSNDVVGDGFSPFVLTGNSIVCDDDGDDDGDECVTGDDIQWEEDYETVPFDNEFSATIAAAQVFIDGVEQTGGQLAAFGEDGEISALDANGATFFPPGGTNVYDLSIWSNNASGEVMTFKFYDAANDVVIDLDETYSFTSNDVVGDGFSPFVLTGVSPECEDGPCDDADADGICDDIDDCVGEYDECGVCNGDGIADDACDCDGNVLDDCGVCGGTGTDNDQDGICDDVDDCVGEYDDCGICNGGNADLDDCGVCFGNNEDLDCNGDCFGTAFIDDCGVCSGGNSGHVANSDIDCHGDCFGTAFEDDCGQCVEGNTGQEENWAQDCYGDCFGNASIDNCDECTGGNTGIVPDSTCSGCTDPTADNYDEDATIDDGTCFYGEDGPVAFQFVESTSQAFYYAFNVNIQENFDNTFPGPLDDEDWVGAFKDLDGDGIGDVCVGARQWDTSDCGGGICDIPLMGVDPFNPEETADYMQEGDIPVFMVYDQSENAFYDAQVLGNDGYNFAALDFPWSPNGVQLMQEISVRYDCYSDLGGHAFIDYCGYCVEGNTGNDEGFADLGCDCDNPAPEEYCVDTDGDELGNPGSETLYCLEESEGNSYPVLPNDWYLDCTDVCIEDPDNDIDGDDICGDVDPCPYDYDNDIDEDGICGDVDECPYDSQNDIDNDGICGDVDECPYDAENDADDDGICGDVDECPYDAENDADDDGICGNDDECPYDADNDIDGDDICGDVDECPYDYYNDADDDGICGDIDECPYDAENDADDDGICGDVDECPYDAENDADDDGICGNDDECPYDAENDADGDEICGDVDECPYDFYNDIDGDGVCGDVDECPYDANDDLDGDGICDCTIDNQEDCPDENDLCPNDPENDADGDGICGDVDECPYDAENDADGDQICGDVDECPYDFYNDADDDGQCGDVDPCPNDAEDDIDGDGLCADIDECPYDAENDADDDGICGDVDECPYDAENDIDGDEICGDVDECPYDYYNDADDDGICGDVDECPYDAENDADDDGICGDVDVCPYDPDNDIDYDGICGDVDICPNDSQNDIDGDGQCCSDENADGVVDDPYCECAADYYDCNNECGGDALEDNCGTCDNIDWNDCESISVTFNDNANLSSFYVLPEDTSVENIFSDVSSNILAVAGASSAAIYDDGWTGTLESINQESGYWVVMSADDELSITGTPINPQTAYTLEVGDNLIGYPLNDFTPILDGMNDEAQSSLKAILGEGQSAYNYNGLWIGSLQYFTPNSGYWFISNESFDFTYQESEILGRTTAGNISVPRTPENFDYYQSKGQAFYYVENIENAIAGDWILAYNGDILVGARKYNGEIIDIPVMGDDLSEYTIGYCEYGDIPSFKLYRPSNGMLNDLSGDIASWSNHNITVIENLGLTNMPTEMALEPAYPNPFNPSTNLSYTLAEEGAITLSIYDINGRLIENIVDSYQNAGSYNVVWDASTFSSGIYFVMLSTNSNMLTQKIMLVK